MTTTTLWITGRPPTNADAYFGYVLIHSGRIFDPYPCSWADVKPGQAWAHCTGWVEHLEPLEVCA